MTQKLTVSKWKAEDDAAYDEGGLLRINSEKPEYASMMLITKVSTIKNGFLNKSSKVGFVTGKLTDLKDLISETGIVEGSNYSEKVGPHKIVTLEITEDEFASMKKKATSEVPGDEGFKIKINPSTSEVMTKDGKDIYRKTEVVAEGSDITDRTISHDIVPTTDISVEEFKGAEKATK